MRRIDVLGIGIGVFGVGGLLYFGLQAAGMDSLKAGIWSQVFLTGGLAIWVLTYLFRVVTHNMTYNQQLQDYEEAVLQKRWEALTPEERERLQAEVEQENQQVSEP